MVRKTTVLLLITTLLSPLAMGGHSQARLQAQEPGNMALINGQWFNGKSFDSRTLYSVNGRFTAKKPAHVDRLLDLAGTWVVPPFGDAHNHNLGTGVEDWDKKAIKKYLSDGVFYVKIQGNLPLTDEGKRRLGINRHDSVDVVLAQGSVTAPGGHPSFWLRGFCCHKAFSPALHRTP